MKACPSELPLFGISDEFPYALATTVFHECRLETLRNLRFCGPCCSAQNKHLHTEDENARLKRRKWMELLVFCFSLHCCSGCRRLDELQQRHNKDNVPLALTHPPPACGSEWHSFRSGRSSKKPPRSWGSTPWSRRRHTLQSSTAATPPSVPATALSRQKWWGALRSSTQSLLRLLSISRSGKPECVLYPRRAWKHDKQSKQGGPWPTNGVRARVAFDLFGENCTTADNVSACYICFWLRECRKSGLFVFHSHEKAKTRGGGTHHMSWHCLV